MFSETPPPTQAHRVFDLMHLKVSVLSHTVGTVSHAKRDMSQTVGEAAGTGNPKNEHRISPVRLGGKKGFL